MYLLHHAGSSATFFQRLKLFKMKNESQTFWLPEPETHDYPAALSYLSLIYTETVAAKFVSELQKAPMAAFKAKDIFRASSLALLGTDNYHVKSNEGKIKDKVKLSPLLLVRDSANGKLIIADGYHRLCAVYLFDEDSVIPCKIV